MIKLFVKPIPSKLIIDIIEYLKSNNRHRDLCLIMIGINTGLRISDILELRVKDVKGKRSIKVRCKKTGRIQRIEINNTLRNFIDKYTESKPSYEYLIKSRNGFNNPIGRVQAYRIIRDICYDVFGIDQVGTHSLRKTYAMKLYTNNNKDIGLVQEALGHESSKDTIKYLGIDKERVAKATRDIRW